MCLIMWGAVLHHGQASVMASSTSSDNSKGLGGGHTAACPGGLCCESAEGMCGVIKL